jgi:hypothetical protein
MSLTMPTDLALAPVKDADVAYTDPRVTAAIVQYLRDEHGLGRARTIWEPFAGSGTFVVPILEQTSARVLCHELDPDGPIHAADFVDNERCWVVLGDAFSMGRPPNVARRADWSVSNPPFSFLDQAIELLAAKSKRGFALLMIGQALTPVKRDWIWERRRPVDTVRLTPRCPFARPREKAKIEAAQAEVAEITLGGGLVPPDLLKLSRRKYNPKGTDMREYSLVVWKAPFNAPRVRDRRLNWKTGRVWG